MQHLNYGLIDCQIILGSEILNAVIQFLKLVSGSRIEFVIDEEGQVKLFPLNVAVETLSGILHRPGIQRSSLEDMEKFISEGANDRTGHQLLVRYLTKDDEQQWQQAVTIIQQNQPCFITNIVLCELVWVLRGANYSFRKDEIITVLEAMLHSAAFEFKNRSTVDQALQRYRQGKADFPDYLIGAVSRQVGCTETVSFDGKLKGEKGFQCLE